MYQRAYKLKNESGNRINHYTGQEGERMHSQQLHLENTRSRCLKQDDKNDAKPYRSVFATLADVHFRI